MTGRRGGGCDRRRANPPAACLAPLLAAAVVAGLGPARAAADAAPLAVSATAAMAGTEHYCTGYETTFHGAWEAGEGGEGAAAGAPVPFRIGVNAGGEGCYAQLNVRTPPGVAPYELPRFGAKARDGGAWTLRYRETVLEIDAGNGTVVRREGGDPPRAGVLLANAPTVEDPSAAPADPRRERWHGRWRGRFPGVSFPIGLHFAAFEAGRVQGRISSLLMAMTFTGWFHGEMLVFRWRNRHVGLVMDEGGEALVYTDYRGRVSRFHRVR